MQVAVSLSPVFEPFTDPYRYKVAFGGRGRGASWNIARILILKAVESKQRILCTRELQKSIKQSVWRLLKDQIHTMGLADFFEIQQSGIYGVNGSEFIFMGIRSNPEEVKSTEGITAAWIEEAENLTEGSWDILDPTVRAANSEIYISFNTRFKFDHIYQTFVANPPPPNSIVIKASYEDNPWFPEVLRKQLEDMKQRDYEKYLHIWKGELKQLAEGAIYGKQITEAKRDGRILDFPITNGEVDTFWDLGKNNQTSIWFMQKVGLEYRLIDYYEERLEEIPHYCRVLKGTADLNPHGACPITEKANRRRAGYNYGTHYMPHDISANSLGMHKPRKQQFEEGGVKPIQRVSQIKDVAEGIEQTRDIFTQCYFHKTNCDRGLDALANYRYRYSEDDDTYRQQPHHDWASNGADAFRQFAQGFKEKTITDDYRGKTTDFRNAEAGWMR
mgnify:CR=1 FL=1